MKAMILSAGLGTRLGPMTSEKPKALVDINGKSVLRLAVEKCTSSGFDDIIINVHHFADLVEEEAARLNRMGFHISVSDERKELLDTGGGLFKARDFFDYSPFLLYNADIVTDLDLAEFYRFHLVNKVLATLAVRKRRGNRFFLVNRDGVLRGWLNKATGETKMANPSGEQLEEISFTGLHIIDPEIFSYMSAGIYSMTSLYLELAGKHNINTFRYDDGYWFDVGTPENLKLVRSYLSNH